MKMPANDQESTPVEILPFTRPPVPLFALRPLAGILLRQVYLYRRSIPRWMEIFYWPLLDLLVWGFLTLYLKQGVLPGSTAAQALLGGLLLWDMLYRSQQGISVVFLEEIWSRNLYNLMVAPVTPYHIIAGAMMTGILKITLSSGTAILLAYLLFSYSLFSLGLSLIPFVLCLVIMGWALGIMTTALILRFGQEAEVLAWGVIFLFQPWLIIPPGPEACQTFEEPGISFPASVKNPLFWPVSKREKTGKGIRQHTKGRRRAPIPAGARKIPGRKEPGAYLQKRGTREQKKRSGGNRQAKQRPD